MWRGCWKVTSHAPSGFVAFGTCSTSIQTTRNTPKSSTTTTSQIKTGFKALDSWSGMAYPLNYTYFQDKWNGKCILVHACIKGYVTCMLYKGGQVHGWDDAILEFWSSMTRTHWQEMLVPRKKVGQYEPVCNPHTLKVSYQGSCIINCILLTEQLMW